MPISVVINTYNAQMYLREVLDTVKDFDEVLICDMESTDDTLSIAREYNCRIVTFEKKDYNIVEPARDFAIHAATHEWVLIVDADELVTPALKEYLYEIIEKPGCADAMFVPRKNKFFGKFKNSWSCDYQLRFLKKEKATWPPYIHSHPVVDGTIEHLPKHCRLMHLADETMQQWVKKMNDYTDYEVQKKSRKNYGLWALFLRPKWTFFREYILRGGFLMGKRGFVNAKLSAMYQMVFICKKIEKKIREQ